MTTSGFCLMISSIAFERIVIDLLFPEVHPALGIEVVECDKAQVGVGDVDEVHLYFCMEFYGI